MGDGLLNLPAAGIVVYTLALTHLTIAAVTIYLHRHQAHHALDLHPAVIHFFRFWLWLTTGMITREWVAVHRKHHAKCETPEDPHSPQILGLRKVLLEGAELYRAAANNAETLERYGRGTPDDWLERHLYSRWRHAGLTLMLLTDLALLGPIGLSVWAIQMLWVPLWAAGVINGVGHAYGYRTFATPDASTNIVPWGLLIGGEELHNNHHAFPRSAKLAARRWEIDIGWFYILLLTRLRLATVRKVAPHPVRITGLAIKPHHALANPAARLQLLESYRIRVLTRVHKEELRRGDRPMRAILEPVSPILRRTEASLDAAARARLRRALARSQALRIACNFRDQLQEIWRDSSAPDGDRRRLRLLEWCRQAESSGVDALRDFALRITAHRHPGTN